MPITPFSPSVRVTADTAKIDRIEMDIGDWYVRGTQNDIADFFQYLGPYPENASARSRVGFSRGIRPLTRNAFGTLFNRPDGTDDQITRIQLKGPGRGSGRPGGRIIASGYLYISQESQTDQAVKKRLRFRKVKLNPTRFVAHQPWPTRLALSVERWDWPEVRINTRPLSSPFRKEMPLDGSDNVLIGDRLLSLGRPEAWPYHLRRYFEAFEAEVSGEFARAYEEAGLLLQYPTGVLRTGGNIFYNLHEVETYWEFSSPNATREVRNLESTLMALGVRSTSRHHVTGRAEDILEGNARSILISLRGGRELRIYAKTNRRIRFEIIHKLEIAAQCRILNQGESRKTTDSLDELLGWFPLLAQDAEKQLNYVLAYIESTTIVEPCATTYELIGKIFAVVADTEIAETILQLLVENGRVLINRHGSPFLAAVKKLRKSGVLQHVFDSDVVTPFYRKALVVLQQQLDATHGDAAQPPFVD